MKCTWDDNSCAKPAANNVSELCEEHHAQFRENLRIAGVRKERAEKIAKRFVGDDRVKRQACVEDIVEAIEQEIDADRKRSG